MGWGNCGTDSRGRPIGYCHAAKCDHPGCKRRIDRGLAYACGGMHGTSVLGGDEKLDDFLESCEGYFCPEHMSWPRFEHEDGAELAAPQLCFECATEADRRYRTDLEWRSLWPTDAPPLASGTEARRAETGTGSVHDGPVAKPDAQGDGA